MKTPKEKHGFFLSQLPHLPGVYKFFDKEDLLLYVGKAKNLKNRVSSYFNQAQQHSYKTLRLVQQIERIEFVLVDTEFDALLLENNLIKSHQPKYNILLKDDKTYPYLCLTKEPFPKLLVLRQVDKSLGTYFGPFTNVKAMYTLLELFKELFTLRTCSLALTEENIQAQKFKVCLEYHLGNCQGPCVGLQNEEAYAKDIAQIQHILKGNIHKVVQYFKQQMQEAAQVLAFEKAELFKQKMAKLEHFQSKSVIVNPNLDDLDAFAIVSDEKMAFVSYLKVVKGAIIYTQNWQIEKKLEEEDAEILQLIIYEIYQKQMLPFNELVSNVDISVVQLANKYTVPKLGDKKKLVDLAIKNALFLKKEKMDQRNQTPKPTHKEVVLQEMQQILKLKQLPLHIECFDNSNIQGTNPVASMVCFKKGVPAKREYRHYNIKTVIGPNDFASMHEIVSRRYTRLLNENQPLPDLIVIDGGKGQLSAACEALQQVGVYGKVAIVGIAKKLEEIYFPNDEIPLHIHKKSPVLKLMQHIRNEAHRFAITFHRQKRSNNSLNSFLDEIPGFGEATVQKLLTHFKSVKKIEEADFETLAQVIGKAKAKLLQEAISIKKATVKQ